MPSRPLISSSSPVVLPRSLSIPKSLYQLDVTSSLYPSCQGSGFVLPEGTGAGDGVASGVSPDPCTPVGPCVLFALADIFSLGACPGQMACFTAGEAEAGSTHGVGCHLSAGEGTVTQGSLGWILQGWAPVCALRETCVTLLLWTSLHLMF